MNHALTPAPDSPVAGSFTLVLHDSLMTPIMQIAQPSGSFGPNEASRLDGWAASCPNPAGQKADLARAVAGLVRVAGTLGWNPAALDAGTFWDAVSQ